MKKLRMAFFALATLTLLATSTGCGGGGGSDSDDDDTPVAESGSTGGSGTESGSSGSGSGSTGGSGTGSTSTGTGGESTGGSGSGSGSASQATVSEATTTVTILPYTNSAIADKVFYRTKEDGKIKYHLFNGGKCYESSNSDYFSNEDDDHPIIISWNGNVYRLDPDKINLRINGSGLFSTFQHGDGGDDAIMTFNSNGSGTIDGDGKTIPLTFTNNAGVLTLSFTYEGKPATALFAYDGTKLYAIDDDLRLIFVKNYSSGSGSGSSGGGYESTSAVTVNKSINGSEVFITGRTVEIWARWCCDHEVTQAEYQTVMGSNPSCFSGTNRPVENVSWYDALVYCNKRSLAEGYTPCYTISGKTDPSDWGTVPSSSDATWNAVTCNWSANGYRLPTDAEWEYFARGGNTSQSKYSGSDKLKNVAWCDENSEDQTHEVKTKAANALGLYDMSGNVWEWCWDWYGAINKNTPFTGVDSGTQRISRGGAYNSSGGCKVSYRSGSPATYYGTFVHGFRVVRSSSN